MNEDEKNLNEKNVEETKDMPDVRAQTGEEERKTIGQKIADIDPEDVGKKFDQMCNWISEKYKAFKGDTSTEAGMKKWKKKKREILVIILVFAFFRWYGGDGPAKMAEPRIVKNAVPTGYTDMTYEDAFKAVCTNNEWKYIGYKDGNHIVEYDGIHKETGSKLCIQFAVDDDYTTVIYMDVDGRIATNVYDIGTTMNYLLTTAYNSINGDRAAAASDKVTTNKINSNDVQAVAPAPTQVPKTEDGYVFDPNGAVKADGYDDETAEDYYGPGDLDVTGDASEEGDAGDTEPVNKIGSEYTFNNDVEFPELTSFDAWTKGGVWYSKETGLYAFTEIYDSNGTPIVVFSTDGTEDGAVCIFVPQTTDDSIGMLRVYGDVIDDYKICRAENMGVSWEDASDYTVFFVSGPKDIPANPIIGTYVLQ